MEFDKHWSLCRAFQYIHERYNGIHENAKKKFKETIDKDDREILQTNMDSTAKTRDIVLHPPPPPKLQTKISMLIDVHSILPSSPKSLAKQVAIKIK